MNETDKKLIKLNIEENARRSLGGISRRFGGFSDDFADIAHVKEYLIQRYGRMPGMRNKVYIDTYEGRQEVGFTHSYWRSNIVSRWFQTDWVMVTDADLSPVLIR